jgi:MFS family permease
MTPADDAALVASIEPVRNPLREETFRELWSASLVSNIGTWMQNVGGVWLMTTLTTEALPVALMQTATTLPALILGLPAGSLADRVDRRKLLLVCQTWMLLCAGVLAVLTFAQVISPWLLLGLTFALGIGSVANAPTWSSIVPEVVSRPQVPTAISMNSAGFNTSRAIGPALGGLVVAIAGPAMNFLLNAFSFLATIFVVLRWHPRVRERPTKDLESFPQMIATGLHYVWDEREQRLVLIRSALWMLCASALWGLLPLVAIRELGLSSTGYGLLVTCVGGGAVVGSVALPRLRARWPTNAILTTSIVTFTVLLLVLAWVPWVPLVCVMLGLGGAAWTTSNQNFQIAVQMRAPRHLQARAIAMYLLTFQGGQAVGAALWGTIAQRAGDPAALTLAAGGMALGILAARRWPVEPRA